MPEINSTLDSIKEKINELRDVAKEMIQNETHRKKKPKKFRSINELWDKFRWSNVYIIGVLKYSRHGKKKYLKK